MSPKRSKESTTKTKKVSKQKTSKKTRMKTTAKRTKRKSDRQKFPDTQGNTRSDYEVGYGRPPRQYQFRPGQSGNPSGCTHHKTHLWTYICEYFAMTRAELQRARWRKNLTMARIIALNMVDYLHQSPKLTTNAAKLLRDMIERDEGKPAVRIYVDREDALSPDECDEIREALRQRAQDHDQDARTGPISGRSDP